MAIFRAHSQFWLSLLYLTTVSGINVSQNQSQAISYTACEQQFITEKFSIVLPKKDKPEPFECRFLVSAYAPDVCRLRLNFRQFVLLSSPSCRDQFFKVGGRRLCGSILGPQEVPFPDSSLIIHYRGLNEHPLEVTVEQVRCKIQAIPKTCDVASSELKTEIASPNYPNPYPTPITCLYTIKTRPEDTCQISIRFLDFDVPESLNCLKGRMMIDGKSYCGKKAGWTVTANASQEFKFDFSAGSVENTGVFRISVEQVLCGMQTLLPGNASSNQLQHYIPNPQHPLQCCNRVFSSPYFVLASPGFLELTPPSDFDCVYQIFPSSPTICRLRISFLHFWLGQEDVYYGCTDGFLEIDGRRFCGCKEGLVIDSFFDGGRKDFWFSMRGDRKKGFILEVRQEDCSDYRGRSLPDEPNSPDNEVEVFSTNSTVEKVRSRFFVPSDDSKCYQWGLPQWLEKVKGFIRSSGTCPVPPPGSVPILPPNNPIIPPPFLPQPPVFPPSDPHQPPVIRPPIEPNPQPPIFPPIRPQPPIIPPHNLPQPPIIPPHNHPQPPIIPPHNHPQPPIIPPHNHPQPPIIPPPNIPLPPIAPPQIPQPIPPISPPYPPRPIPPIAPPPVSPLPPLFSPNCPPQNPIIPIPPPTYNPGSGRCQVFSSLQGGFQSPGYPWNYPSDLKCCYRFRQFPGFCRLQLTILDFDVSWTPKCWKDYLLLDKKARYCGRALHSSASYLPFRNGLASVDFVSNSFVSSRGFRAVFRQVPCFSNSYIPRSDSKPPSVTPNPSFDGGFVLNVTPV